MSLRTCTDCKKSVSTSAKSCPHCGALPPKPKSLGCTGMMMLVLLFGAVVTILDKNPSKTASEASELKIETPKKGVDTQSPPRLLSKPIKEVSPPFLLPTQYINMTPQQAAKSLGKNLNEAGNITVENSEAKLHISTSGDEKISYSSVELKQMGKCLQSKDFDSKTYLRSVGIDPNKLEFARKQTHYHTYYDHNKKLKVFVACLDDNWPYTVGISKKYYLQ